MSRYPLYSTKTWQRTRLEILARDNYRCKIQMRNCTGKATCVDHIIPVDEGGPWFDHSNLRAACVSCNNARGWKSRKIREVKRMTQVQPREW